MTSCPKLVDSGRRKFLSGAGLAAAGMAAASVTPSPATSAPAPARVEYPSNRLANVRDLKPNEPLDVAYPDRDAPGVLLKLGKPFPPGLDRTAISSASRPPVRIKDSRSATANPITP